MNERITKYILKELSEEEVMDFFRELDDKPELKKEYLDTLNLMGMSSLKTRAGDVEEGRKMLEIHRDAINRKHKSFSLSRIAKFSAVVVFAMLVAGFSTYFFTRSEENTTLTRIETEGGDRAQISLPDGTKVWLSFNSSLQYPSVFSDSMRNVSLNGEAFFEVAENKEVPFIVRTAKYDVRVTGTEFNVMCYDDNLYFETALILGGVDIYSAVNKEYILSLTKNQQVRLEDGRLVKTQINPSIGELWKNGEIHFEDTSLKSIFDRLSIYYDVKIEVLNADVLEYVYTGTFDSGDPIEDVLDALKNIREFSYAISDDKKHIEIQ